MGKFVAGWYVIYTKPYHEKSVYTHLMKLNIDTLFPTRKAVKVWSDRRKLVTEPLFPSYVFIYIEDMRNYFDAKRASGFLSYVKMGKELALVNDDVVKNIRIAVSMGSDLEVSGYDFAPGRKLLVSRGPFAGLSCELVQYNRNQKLLVRVELLSRCLLLSIPGDYVVDGNHPCPSFS